jgi:hypothetical protein
VEGVFPSTSLFFAALLLAEGLGDLHPIVAKLLAWTLLLVYGAGVRRTAPGWAGPRRLALGLAVAGGAIALSRCGGGAATFAVPAWLLALDVGLDLRTEARSGLRSHLAWAYGFGLVSLLYHQDPFTRMVVDGGAIWLGGQLADRLGARWAPASTALGFLVVAAYVLAVFIALFRLPRGMRAPVAVLSSVLLISGLAAYVIAVPTLTELYQQTAYFATLPEPADLTHAGQHNPDPVRWVTPLALLYPSRSQILLAATLALGACWISRRLPSFEPTATAPVEPASWARHMALGAVGVGWLASSVWIWSPRADYAPLDGLRVMIHKKYIDWSRPVFGNYGDRAGGMFGMLADHTRARGCSVTDEPLDQATRLENQDVLILINLQERFDEVVKRRIRDFVRRGGGLLIAGDHTGLTGLREPTNDLVKDLGIELNFDTAKPFPRGWTSGLEFMANPITRGLPWWVNESNIWVGASLTVRYPAYPIVIGRYAFIDPGDQTSERGKLGDMKYSDGERLGDVPLVAAREYGRGRIVVWGDTSPLQNGAWLFSHRYMERTLGWLGKSGGGFRSTGRALAGPLFLAAAALLAALPRRWMTKSVAMTLVVVGTVGLQSYGETIRPPTGRGPGLRAYIDVAHMPGDDMEIWLRDGFGGFAQTLARMTLLPYALWDWDDPRWEDGKLVVLVAPARSLDETHQARLLDYVNRGGHLLIAVGWEESRALEPFLERIGLRVENSPLGNSVGTSWQGKPVRFNNVWPIAIGSGLKAQAEVLARVGDAPCIVSCPSGKGRITLIGDSRFLRNSNLEGRSEIVPENMEFVRNLVQEKILKPSPVLKDR